ncbi:MAG TPA: nuclear transport factor 2 family protein [Ktedonobacteraceae bacterium]|nr:nuclear transport factor 2 family protein [Ktedonobacteraceae bacterium]
MTTVPDREENLLLVNRWIEAFNGHNVGAIVALYAEDAELFDSGMKHPRRGHDEITEWFTTRFRMTPTIAFASHYQFSSDQQVAVQWTTRGRIERLLAPKWLIRPMKVEGMSIYCIEDRLIKKQRGYYDHLSAIEQTFPPVKWLPLPRL